MRLLVLPRYGPSGASSRLRSYQYAPAWAAAGITCTFAELFPDAALQARYRNQTSYPLGTLLAAYQRRCSALLSSRTYDAVLIEKEALPWIPAWLELLMLRRVPVALDFDDAIFHNYDQHANPLVRWLYRDRIDRLMRKAALVIAGNDYLAARAASAGARRIEILPTVIDLARYPQPEPGRVASSPPVVVWIGTPHTVKYLTFIEPALLALARRMPYRLRIIGGGRCPIPGLDHEVLPWSEASEVGLLASSDVGIMPLHSTPWELGKCSYKLIQYMACGLPTVASAVGANTTVVADGQSGFLVTDNDRWLARLEQLLRDGDLRRRMGLAGRARVEQRYCLQVTGGRYAELLLSLKRT